MDKCGHRVSHLSCCASPSQPGYFSTATEGALTLHAKATPQVCDLPNSCTPAQDWPPPWLHRSYNLEHVTRDII